MLKSLSLPRGERCRLRELGTPLSEAERDAAVSGLRGAEVTRFKGLGEISPDEFVHFIGRLGDPYSERLVDRDGRAGIDLGVTGVPETYLVGPGGQILAKHTGPLTPEKARELLAKAPR